MAKPQRGNLLNVSSSTIFLSAIFSEKVLLDSRPGLVLEVYTSVKQIQEVIQGQWKNRSTGRAEASCRGGGPGRRLKTAQWQRPAERSVH